MEPSHPISLWQNLQEILKDQDTFTFWQHLHGGSTHFPIALLFVAALFDFGSSIFKQTHWRTVGFWCLMLSAAAGVVACASGLAGGNGWFGVQWDGRGMTDGEANIRSLANHRMVALISTGIILVLALWRSVRRDKLEKAEWGTYLVALTVGVIGILTAGLLGAYVSKGM